MYNNIKSIIFASDSWNSQANYPLYLKLFYSLKNAIVAGLIPGNIKLPPTRVLAQDLNISRSTVIKVYDLLLTEQYIKAKPGSGYVVSYISNTENIIKFSNKKSDFRYPSISKRARSFLKNKYISSDSFSKKSIAFRPGLPPLDIFPVEKWNTISKQYWRESNPSNLSYSPAEGLETLRYSIANYLKLYRNIDCDYNQIIIVSGSLHSLYLIGNTVLDKGDKVIMENPTFPKAYNLFKSLKASVIPTNIDLDGININAIKAKKVKLIYTTPSNQYPLGIKMSLNRRNELLKWASKNNSLIIEDDYDHEFSNWLNPIPSLYSLDKECRVIYQGTFNKLLHPSLRLGYMIVPKYLLKPIKAIFELSSRFVASSTQEIMNQFIEKDYLNKHLRNVIKTAKERKDLFIKYTKKTLVIDSSNGGLHLIGSLKKDIKDTVAFKTLLKNNTVAYPLSFYYITKEKKQGLVMGYSSVNTKVLKEKTDIINKILS